MPGNEEDLKGKVFVGPAGRVLNEALAESGFERESIYLTNVVKHFKWEPRGNMRLHKKPNTLEVASCLPWLQAEIEVVQPEMLICLGSTAAQSLLGKDFRVTKRRGEIIPYNLAPWIAATVHPSSVLRAPSELRKQAMKDFVADLTAIRNWKPT